MISKEKAYAVVLHVHSNFNPPRQLFFVFFSIPNGKGNFSANFRRNFSREFAVNSGPRGPQDRGGRPPGGPV